MERVLVLDKNQQPLMPCLPQRTRLLIEPGKVVIFRRYPFTNLCCQTPEKNHCIDARYIGKSPPVKLKITGIRPLLTERTAIAMLPGLSPQQFYHLERPPYQTASPMPATTKLSTAMMDVSMGEER